MENLGFGLQITVLGMGLVFGLLVLLWGLLTLVLRLDRAEPEPAAVSVTAAPPSVQIVGRDGLDPELVAAITIAVLTHADVRRLQAAPAMRSYWPGSLLYASRWVVAGRLRQNRVWRQGRGK